MASVNGVPWIKVKSRIIEEALLAYPMAEDAIDALARRVSNLEGHTAERNQLLGKVQELTKRLQPNSGVSGREAVE